MKILFVGDVQGTENIDKFGRVCRNLKSLEKIDAVIVNGENSADTNGISPNSAKMLFDAGADVITTGNHAFKRKEAAALFEERAEVIRPANFGESCPGKGFYIMDFGYCKLCVVNIMGMTYMPPCDNPFKEMDRILGEIKQISCKNILVDFHAEATSEKRAMCEYLAGRVSAVIGTHTHVQTADERIVTGENGGKTAYITDAGMVGALDSIIGAEKKIGKIFYDYYPVHHKYAVGESEFNAVIIEIDESCGNAVSIKRIRKTL